MNDAINFHDRYLWINVMIKIQERSQRWNLIKQFYSGGSMIGDKEIVAKLNSGRQ